MSKVIGILGCGWLGLPLANDLLAQGYIVKGSTTTLEKLEVLRKKGIEPYQIVVSENGIEGPFAEFLNNLDILIINIPPGLRGKGPKENYVVKVRRFANAVQNAKIQRLIFISSTSVYGETQGKVDERTPPQPTSASGKQLLASEQLLRENSNFDITIIRFGGLVGEDRHPVTMLSGRTGLEGGNAPINLIHLNDAIGIIGTIINKDGWGEIINAVFPDHPSKQEYYRKEAKKRNLEPPEYQSDNSENHKIIQSCNIFLAKNYSFLTSV